MKIIYCITKADNGGAQTHLIQLANHFCLHHDVYVIVGDHGPMIEQLDTRVKVIVVDHLVGPIDIKQDILAIKALTQLFSKIQPDVIHLHSSKAGTVGRIANLISKSKGARLIFTAHGWAFTEGVKLVKKIIYLTIERLMSRITDCIICVSKFDEKLAVKYRFNRLKLTTIHNGIADVPVVKQTYKNHIQDTLIEVDGVVGSPINSNGIQVERPSQHQFVMIARFAYPKLQQNLIAAIAILKSQYRKHAHFTFIGDGPTLNDCKQQVSQAGLDNDVTFLGNVINASNLLSQYDTFILISKHEGLPISIIEAMATGLPVIASRVGGITELLTNNGICVKNNQPETIAKVLEKYLTDGDYDTLSKQSRKRYLECFTEAKMIKEVEDVYNGKSTQ
ncbi:glycosyltransferase family 4 protein [Staphylococcus argenteus]|uniref:glycosyltransferase family 4 protein n=1 Tax=Staphylococcus argenteus TaxID=985002 RepID=UPI001FBA7992|nr:glycosyltransferase family 4 protein [Staphylococcus argenteus]GJF54942.1 glycosyltransferase family 4 protein [Staphylococcus argenteus]GJF60842.1 glycosyltransferase family 4 protein [Staphylococcus argenteus]GJF73086.1 glycosyltransferase family 4 protein [Staphylococcus argenteus]GJF86610.1 glycosyltransferase family 4 protein [Staphylococcus argenteus]GJF94299.1 glycosyltransferase family 4 protein [Staphylococcus argenteus]